MPNDALHQPLAQSAPAMRLQHKHISHIRDRCKITDHTGKASLKTFPVINSETERALYRPHHNLSRDSFGPIAIGEETVDHIQIQAFAAGTDQKLATPIFLDSFEINHTTGRHAHILPLRCECSAVIPRHLLPTMHAFDPARAILQNAVRKNEAKCHPSM